jgi:hypothetical protein
MMRSSVLWPGHEGTCNCAKQEFTYWLLAVSSVTPHATNYQPRCEERGRKSFSETLSLTGICAQIERPTIANLGKIDKQSVAAKRRRDSPEMIGVAEKA